jgi:hypothetical protein
VPVKVGGEELGVDLRARGRLVRAKGKAVASALLVLAVEAVVVEVILLDLLHVAGGVRVEAEANGAGHIKEGGTG